MAKYQLKHTFTAGELSPLLEVRTDFDRYANGCKKLYNAYSLTQGPATRRPGFKFIYDMGALGLDIANPIVREIPFIYNSSQAYSLVFFMHTDGTPRMAICRMSGIVLNDLGTPAILTLPATWDIMGFDWAQSADEVYCTQATLPPSIIRRTAINEWVRVNVTFTDQPADWSVANGYPSCVVFHQQRIAYAATKVKQRTVWLSKAGDFSDFGKSSPLVDSDAVTFTLDSGTQNSIQWMVSSKALNIGTLGSEWTVTGSNQASLTPTNIYALEQTGAGSETLKPLKIGATTVFLEKHGRVINEFAYDYNSDGYTTSDITVLAEHLTEKYSVVDWAYQSTPYNIIWSVREDGALLGLTYQRQHKVVGWHHHATQGEFKAITSIPGSFREDDVIAIVCREINGSTKYYLEGLAKQFIGPEASDGFFLDSYLVYDSTPTDIIHGLTHLIGKEVHILADGTVQPPQVVPESGTISLDGEFSKVVVGLQYITEIHPMVPELDDKKGTSKSRTQVIVDMALNLYRSLGCVIGRVDDEDGSVLEEEIPFRVPNDITGLQVPLFTGWKSIGFPEGLDTDAGYYIRQEQPLPLTVRGIVNTVEVY